MRRLIDAQFPALAAAGYEIVGEPSYEYNCIAYAAGETHRWWSHEETFRCYWPEPASRTPLIASLVEVFAALGYEPVTDDSVETGYVKVALYQNNGQWTHAGRQMPNGHWRSKLGAGPLIEHYTLQSLAGELYGAVHCVMRRRWMPDQSPANPLQ